MKMEKGRRGLEGPILEGGKGNRSAEVYQVPRNKAQEV